MDEQPLGLCEVTFSNGDTYKGYIKDGKKNGRGTLTYSQSKVYVEGFWRDDVLLSIIESCLPIYLLNERRVG